MEKKFKLYMAKSGRPVQLEKEYSSFVYEKWNKLGLYKKVNENLHKDGVKPFVFVDGPPYANGAAHLGHVLNKVWKDLTVKSQWYLGNETQWVPGWDCHGLPLELQVDKKYPDLSEEEKKLHCKKLALKSLSLQRSDFKSLGVHADWENPYLTLSNEMRQASWKTVLEMYNQELLQYKMWPVHHCPACGSSLAEAELEYSNKER
jgi:isoleucyl-tRNA synthetase